jgi:3-oxoadipate enol-lactonase
VVLLHAVGMDLTTWDQQIEALHPTCDVVALDLPGHGLSPRLSGDLSFSAFAAAAAQLIEELAAGPVHLVGISFGSMVAQTVALEYPALVRSLSLIGAAGTFAEAGRAALRARADFVRTEGIAAVTPLSLARWFTPTFSQQRPDVLDRVSKLLAQQPAAYHAALWDMIATLDTLAGLPRLTLPALLIVGEADTSTPPAAAHALAAALRTPNRHVVPHSAHFTNLDAPGAVSKLLVEFFDSLR